MLIAHIPEFHAAGQGTDYPGVQRDSDIFTDVFCRYLLQDGKRPFKHLVLALP